MSEIKQNTLLEDALKELAELQQENVQLKQELLDSQDRLAHVEPVFAMAKDLAYHVNPYLQGEKQAQITAWFSRNGYKNYHEDHNL